MLVLLPCCVVWCATRNAPHRYLHNYTFIVEAGSDAALPQDQRLFADIMSKAKDWGMFMYEQYVFLLAARHACHPP